MKSVLCLALAFACVGAASDRVNTVGIFAPIAQKLQQSGVPVLLPGVLPADDLNGLRAELRQADRSGYTIELDYDPACNGASACYYGSVIGAKSDGGRPEGKQIALSDGTQAYFLLGTCGASCSDSTLTFDRGGYRYRFASKGASSPALEGWAAYLLTPADLP